MKIMLRVHLHEWFKNCRWRGHAVWSCLRPAICHLEKAGHSAYDLHGVSGGMSPLLQHRNSIRPCPVVCTPAYGETPVLSFCEAVTNFRTACPSLSPTAHNPYTIAVYLLTPRRKPSPSEYDRRVSSSKPSAVPILGDGSFAKSDSFYAVQGAVLVKNSPTRSTAISGDTRTDGNGNALHNRVHPRTLGACPAFKCVVDGPIHAPSIFDFPRAADNWPTTHLLSLLRSTQGF